MERESTRFHPLSLALPFFLSPPLPPPSPAQDWTTCQWPELVPTHSHPGPTPLVLVSFSLGFIHPLVLASLSRGTYQPIPSPLSLFTWHPSSARCIFTRFSFHYDNSTCLHLSSAGTRFDVFRCSIFLHVFLSYRFFSPLSYRFPSPFLTKIARGGTTYVA